MDLHTSTSTTSNITYLTPSERSIRYYNDQGLTSGEIASMLNLSPITVHYYQNNLRLKLAHNNHEAPTAVAC